SVRGMTGTEHGVRPTVSCDSARQPRSETDIRLIAPDLVATGSFLPSLDRRLRPRLHAGAAVLLQPEPVFPARPGPGRPWAAPRRLAGQHRRPDAAVQLPRRRHSALAPPLAVPHLQS